MFTLRSNLSDVLSADLYDLTEVHRPILQLSADGATFTLHMPVLGLPSDTRYTAFYDDNYIILARQNTAKNAEWDKTVLFLLDRKEYRVNPKKSLFIREAFWSRAEQPVSFVPDSQITQLAEDFRKLGRPYFPYSPFAYYYKLFTASEHSGTVCSCCGNTSDVFYNNTIHQPGIGFDERVLSDSFRICPRCVAEGRLPQINGYINEANSHVLVNCTPGIKCRTEEVFREYIEYNQDGCYYCDDMWPCFDGSEEGACILPVFIGYLRKNRDSDSAPYSVLSGEREDICNDIGYENMEMLGLDEIPEDAEDEYTDEINNADIRIFAHFEVYGDGLRQLPLKDGKVIAYSLDVPLRGHTD